MAKTRLDCINDTNKIGSLATLQGNRHVLIAVDGGGTRTKCAVFGESGQVLAQAEAGPSNHLVLDGERAFSSLKEAIHAAMAACGADKSQVDAISAGLAGVDA